MKISPLFVAQKSLLRYLREGFLFEIVFRKPFLSFQEIRIQSRQWGLGFWPHFHWSSLECVKKSDTMSLESFSDELFRDSICSKKQTDKPAPGFRRIDEILESSLVCLFVFSFKAFKAFRVSETSFNTALQPSNYDFFKVNYDFFKVNYDFFKVNYDFFKVKL